MDAPKVFAKKIRLIVETGRVKAMIDDLGPSREALNVLDIGSATGSMLEVVGKMYPQSRLYGVDISEEACEIARGRGLDVKTGRFEDVKFDNSFDFIYCANIIEHLAEPRKALERMRDILNPGGHIVLITPETDSYCHRLYHDRYWGGYHVPRHWNLWSRENFQRMAADLGLDLLGVQSVLCPTNWVWSWHHYLDDRTFLPKSVIDTFNFNNPLWMGLATFLDLVCGKIHHTGSMQLTLTKK
jgi:SAM-dependent methyltransferase